MTLTKAPPVKRDICGDMKGWNAHNRHGERQCMPCKVAHAEYQNEWRHRTGRSHSRLYTNAEIAAIQRDAKSETLTEAEDEMPKMTPDQIRAVLAAHKRRTLLDAADQIPHPQAAEWLRKKAEEK